MSIPPRLRHALVVGNHLRVESHNDNAVIVAAGVAFYAVLALLPAVFLSLSIYGLFTDVDEAERQIEALIEVFPQVSESVLETQIRSIADASHANLSIGFALSVVGLLWTVSNATRALIRAVKIAYDQEEDRSILENRFVAIGLTFGVIVGIVIAIAAVAAFPIWLTNIDPTNQVVTIGNLRWLLVGAAMALGTALLYRYAPPQRPDGWGSVVPGVVFATVMWTAASIGFSIYVSSFGSYNETYGALGAAVVLLLWFWLTALAIILGAELNEALILHPHDADADHALPDLPFIDSGSR